MVLYSYTIHPTRHLLLSMSEEGRTEAMSADPKYVVRTLAQPQATRKRVRVSSLAYSFYTTNRWSCSTSTRRCTTST